MTPLERLKVLREVAANLPLEDQCVLVDDVHAGWNQRNFVNTEGHDRGHFCNTNMCLAGWAGIDKRLQADGLITKLKASPDTPSMFWPVLMLDGDSVRYIALSRFFGLSTYEAHDLFGETLEMAINGDYGEADEPLPYTEENRAKVVARIDQLITKYGDPDALTT